MNPVEQSVEWVTRGFGVAAESVRKRHLVAKSVLIGLVSGSLGVGFRLAPEWVRDMFSRWRDSGGWPLPVTVSVAAALGAISVWLVRRYAPEAGGGGMPHLRVCLAREAPFRWWRVLWVKVLSLLTGVAGGLGLGAEAPAIHAGGACGQGLAHLFRAPRGLGEHRALRSAGAAAGLSAAFNAPLAGVIFVLEELQGDFSTPVLVCAVIASATADVLSRAVVGHPPVFHLHGVVCPSGVWPLLGATLVGVVAGLVGGVFNRWVVVCAKLGAGRFASSRILIGAVASAVTMVFSLSYPGLVGGGTALVEFSLGSAALPSLLLTLVLLRFGATLLAVASGASGGFMIPLLALGALFGRLLGDVWNRWWPAAQLPAPIFVAVGMGAFFSASVRAPLTALVLVLELTGDYGFMLPALIACMVAFLLAEELGIPPVYHVLGAASSGSETGPAGQNKGITESSKPHSSSQSITEVGASANRSD